jgi:hypothetical protein
LKAGSTAALLQSLDFEAPLSNADLNAAMFCNSPMLTGLRVYRRRRYAEPQPPIRRITQHCPASGTAPMNLGLRHLSQACRKNDKNKVYLVQITLKRQ